MTEEADWALALATAAGEDAVLSEAYGFLVVDVDPSRWVPTLTAARDHAFTYFDWLSAVDELDDGFRVVAHVVDVAKRPPLHLLVRTLLPRDAPTIATATGVFAGAGWHERETHEMFGVDFDGHPSLKPLLLPDGFEGHPLRKEFVLAARAAKPWPGAKDPGESDEGGAPARRRMLPPGVPDPAVWGPRRPGARSHGDAASEADDETET